MGTFYSIDRRPTVLPGEAWLFPEGVLHQLPIEYSFTMDDLMGFNASSTLHCNAEESIEERYRQPG